ncbi:MAG: cation-translocating P-type ATPase [Thermodesulfobacteriota bacterium]
MPDAFRRIGGDDAVRSLPFLTVPEVYAALRGSPLGLTNAEAASRLRVHGPNTLRKTPGRPLLFRLAATFTHLMALLLWAGGAIAFVAGMPQLGVAVWLVNVINGFFSFWQEFKAEKALAALRRMLPVQALVLRGGREVLCPAEELVPGDMLVLAEGGRVCADARLVEAADLRVDQSTLTGESHPVRKQAEPLVARKRVPAKEHNVVFTGTSITSGNGRAVVFATGMGTEFGRIAQLTQSLGKEQSPLQKEIAVVTRGISLVAVGAGLLFYLLALFLAHMGPTESFIFALGMIVAFVPEGLLPTVTLALAMGIQRMAGRNAMVKRLSAVETLGCTTVICTDKTGTLTKNEMSVKEVWFPGRTLLVTGTGYAPAGEILENGAPVSAGSDTDLADLLVTFGLCNNARLSPAPDAAGQYSVLGDPMEASLLALAGKAGVDLESEDRAAPRVYELPFDPHLRRMCVCRAFQGSMLLLVKGAPAEVAGICTGLRRNGRDGPMTDAARRDIEAAATEMARRGLRVLAAARGTRADAGRKPTWKSLESGLVFLGLAAISDPPRPEVPGAIATCRRAGIRTVMITGDYGPTAESIAREIGLVGHGPVSVLTGDAADAESDAALAEILRGEVIFARATPECKLRVVRLLQGQGHVVAVTGDGVNDAPALKKADIGVAMGLSGTDVAKEAADMILADDNFASIVNAIEEGRAVYANIKKFTGYIFTSNMPEAIPFILHAMSGGRIPLALTVMQILAVDLGTDIVPALALGVEPPEPDIMDRPPRDLKEHVITWRLLAKSYLFLGVCQGFAAMAAFYFQFWTNGHAWQWLDLPASGTLYQTATAMTLACIVTTQIGNLLTQRSDRLSILRVGLGANRMVWIGVATELVLVSLIIYLPGLRTVFGVSPFPLANWLFLFAWAPLLLVVDEVRKALARGWDRGLPLPDARPGG